jgi:uncharacterized protein YgiM (DUF1202 family)
MTRRRRWLVLTLVVFTAAAIPAIGTGVERLRARRDKAEAVVVTARDVPLRLGNGMDYPVKVELPRGCEVRRLFERSGWLQVKTGGGEVGWLPATAVVAATH